MKKNIVLRYKARFDTEKNYHYINRFADNMVYLYQRNRLKNNSNYDSQNISYKRYTEKPFNNTIASEDLKSVVLTALLELNKLGYFSTHEVTYTTHKTMYNRINKNIGKYHDLEVFTVTKNISTSDKTELQLVCDDIEVVKTYKDGTVVNDTISVLQYCFSVLNEYLNHERFENPVSLYEEDSDGNIYSIFDTKTVAKQLNSFNVSNVSRDNVILKAINDSKYCDEIFTYIDKKVEGMTDVAICKACGWSKHHTETIKSHVYKVFSKTCKRNFVKAVPSIGFCPSDCTSQNEDLMDSVNLLYYAQHYNDGINIAHDTTDRQTDRQKEAQRLATMKSGNERKLADFEKCNDTLLMSAGLFNDIATTKDHRRYLTVTEKAYPYM